MCFMRLVYNNTREQVSRTQSANPNFQVVLHQIISAALHRIVRRRIKGHPLVSKGTTDTIICHPSEAFRLAGVASATAIIRQQL